MKRVAPRIGFVDKPGGRKIHGDAKPLGGGVAILWAVALPMLVVVLASHVIGSTKPELTPYVGGVRMKTALALAIIAAALVLHILGLIDDRKALGPYLKLVVQ